MKPYRRTRSLVILGIIQYLLSGGSTVSAITSAPTGKEPVEAELVAEVTAIQPGVPFWVALRLEMNDGWHVNWSNPGDAGLAPTIDWTLPDGFKADDIRWPYPELYKLPQLSIFGYGEEVLLLVEITPPANLEPGNEMNLEAEVNWLACREACVPGSTVLTLVLPVEASATIDRDWAESFEKTRARLPVKTPKWSFEAKLGADRIVLYATPPGGQRTDLTNVTFFPSVQGVIENSARQTLTRSERRYRLELQRATMSVARPKRLRGVLVSVEGGVFEGRHAVEIDIPLE